MTESDFQHNLAGANCLRRYSGLPDTDFWTGYLKGLSRHYHGETFGTTEEHSRWLTLSDEQRHDEQRRFRGLGYRAGFNGMPIADAIKHLQTIVGKTLAASAAGSVRSERKTAAARENARKPRPGARGKKPRKPK